MQSIVLQYRLWSISAKSHEFTSLPTFKQQGRVPPDPRHPDSLERQDVAAGQATVDANPLRCRTYSDIVGGSINTMVIVGVEG